MPLYHRFLLSAILLGIFFASAEPVLLIQETPPPNPSLAAKYFSTRPAEATSWYNRWAAKYSAYEGAYRKAFPSEFAVMTSEIAAFVATATVDVPAEVTDPATTIIATSIPDWLYELPDEAIKAKIQESDEIMGEVAELVAESEEELRESLSSIDVWASITSYMTVWPSTSEQTDSTSFPTTPHESHAPKPTSHIVSSASTTECDDSLITNTVDPEIISQSPRASANGTMTQHTHLPVNTTLLDSASMQHTCGFSASMFGAVVALVAVLFM